MKLEDLFKIIEKDGKTELSESFKGNITEAFKTVEVDAKSVLEGQLTLKDGEITGLKDLLGEAKEAITDKDSEIEKIKGSTLETVKEEVEAWQEDLVGKLDSFLDEEVAKVVPESIIEAAAKVEIYEPIVEGFKSTLLMKGIEINSEGHETLKEAKTEIETLRNDVNEKTESFLQLEKKSEQLLSAYLLEQKCDGMTPDQKEKVINIFKNDSVDAINEKFDHIRDLVINEESKTEKEVEDEAGEGKTSVSESAEQEAGIVVESNDEDLGASLL